MKDCERTKENRREIKGFPLHSFRMFSHTPPRQLNLDSFYGLELDAVRSSCYKIVQISLDTIVPPKPMDVAITIEDGSKAYEDITLSFIFLLNNHWSVLQFEGYCTFNRFEFYNLIRVLYFEIWVENLG